MTYEEAIEFTKINVEIYCKDCLYKDDCSRTDNCRCTEWEKLVVEALEKQIPKKPILVEQPFAPFDESDMYQCIVCKHFIADANYEYPQLNIVLIVGRQ